MSAKSLSHAQIGVGIVSAVVNGVDYYNTASYYGWTSHEARTKATTIAGAEFGGWAGAEAGAFIGTTICPGWGTIIGAGIGGVVGSVAGEQLTIYMLNR